MTAAHWLNGGALPMPSLGILSQLDVPPIVPKAYRSGLLTSTKHGWDCSHRNTFGQLQRSCANVYQVKTARASCSSCVSFFFPASWAAAHGGTGAAGKPPQANAPV